MTQRSAVNKISFFIALLIIFNLSFVISTASSSELVEELVRNIEEKAAAIKGISGSFSQESFLVDLERTETYAGRFFIKKPSMIRFFKIPMLVL